MTGVKAEIVRTLYWDAKELRFVYIVWNKTVGRGQPHKLPKSILHHQVAEAEQYVLDHKY